MKSDNRGFMIELLCLKHLLILDNYIKFRRFVVIKDNRELKQIFSILDDLVKQHNRSITIQELKLTTLSQDEGLGHWFDKIEGLDVGDEVTSDLVKRVVEKQWAYDHAMLSVDVSEGRKPMSLLTSHYDSLETKESTEGPTFVTDDLEHIYKDQVQEVGLRWRLDSLNKSLGSLRRGNFLVAFARPESYSRDTEVLTPSGWVRVDEVTLDTEIAQVHPDLTTSFIKPDSIHPHEQTHCYHIHDTLGRVDLIVTEGHGMIYEKEGKLFKERADTVSYHQGIKHHVAARSSYQSDGIDNLTRLAIAYQADGRSRVYNSHGYRQEEYTYAYELIFKKKRKIDRFTAILDNTPEVSYTTWVDKKGYTGFYVKSHSLLTKDLSHIDFHNKSADWCKSFIEEISHWDATRRTDTRYKFDTTTKVVANKVQAIAILAGYNCLLSVFKDNRSENYNDIYSLSIRTNYQPVDGRAIRKDRISFSDTTYCFTVPSGMLLVRRNGAVAVSGNSGKTTWLSSEVSHMAEQAAKRGLGPILWFNNEQEGKQVKIRVYQASLGVTTQRLFEDRGRAHAAYMKRTQGLIKIYDNADIQRHQVDAMCKELNPSLVLFDQIDKVKGFNDDREDLRLGAIYIWARELAKRYCPVIGICQAAGSGEGVKWLTMGDMSNSKTSKAAEADVILGIGKSHDPGTENLRYINICKNKLTGDSDSDPSRRHSRIEVLIDADIARYKDYQ